MVRHVLLISVSQHALHGTRLGGEIKCFFNVFLLVCLRIEKIFCLVRVLFLHKFHCLAFSLFKFVKLKCTYSICVENTSMLCMGLNLERTVNV